MASAFLDHAIAATHVVPRQAAATSSAGAARKDQQSSASTVLNTLWPVVLYSLGFFVLFLVLRRRYPRIYRPRTFVGTLRPQERTAELPNGMYNSCRAFFKTRNIQVLNTQGTLDGYLFLRLLRISVVCCLVGCIILYPVLLPINATGASNQTQFNILTFSNVASPTDPNSYYRFYAHVICAWVFFSFILYTITRESLFYINLRQAYLVSPSYADRISSRTVLFLSVPNEYLKVDILRDLLGPDRIRNIWIPLNTDELENKVGERDDMLTKLENAEIDLIKKANAARRKALKKDGLAHKEQTSPNVGDESGSVAARWLRAKDRPTHRLGLWGLWGEKVDTINWCRSRLISKIDEVKVLQEEHRALKGQNRHAAFVQFHTLADAQAAFQALTHHQPLHMAPRLTGMYPQEIIWGNLRIKWWERIIRTTAAYSVVIAVIVLWSFPIAFVGSVSKIKYLEKLPGLGWLDFINKLGIFTGVITGLLPVILLSILMAILPIFLRLMARLGGDPTWSAVEYTVQSTYFWFYVIQGFLVTTLSSGAIQAAATIFKNPASVVNLLATSLPESSNFYLSYFVLQGLGIVSQVLVSIAGLFLFLILGKLFDNSPRKLYRRWINLSSPSLGTLYPTYTTMLVIAISYSCIAPLVLGFATIGLALFYVAFKYEFLYVYSVQYDTKGLMYARALQQLFVGLYLAEGCLIGLFAINIGNSNIVLGPLILMIIFLVFTALYHYSLNAALAPTLQFLPKTLEREERRLLEEEEAKLDLEYGVAGETAKSEKVENDNSQAGLSSSPTSADTDQDVRGPSEDTKKPAANFFMKWLRPDKYTDYHALRRLVPKGTYDLDYPKEIEDSAYMHPYVIKEPQLLWLPRDDAGVSKQEVEHTAKVTPITDAGAQLDDKGAIVWNRDDPAAAPIHQPFWYF